MEKACSSPCSHVATDGFLWKDAHLPSLLAEAAASDYQVRPLKAKSEAFSLMAFTVAIKAPLSRLCLDLMRATSG